MTRVMWISLWHFGNRRAWLELIRIERELSESLGMKVDLVTEHSVNPYVMDTMRESSVSLEQ